MFIKCQVAPTKAKYASAQDAEIALRRTQANDRKYGLKPGHKPIVRTYLCDEGVGCCGAWHLTSAAARQEPSTARPATAAELARLMRLNGR